MFADIQATFEHQTIDSNWRQTVWIDGFLFIRRLYEK